MLGWKSCFAVPSDAQGRYSDSASACNTTGEEELRQTNRMINQMLLSYVLCLALGWRLLFFDRALNEVEKHPKAEPWINDAVVIGGGECCTVAHHTVGPHHCLQQQIGGCPSRAASQQTILPALSIISSPQRPIT
jgi:hypothetical protein